MHHKHAIYYAGYPNYPEIRWKTETFNKNNATIILEWIQEIGVSYNVDVNPNPQESKLNGNTSQLTVLYNTTYNVTVVATLCGQNTTTAAIDITVNQSGQLYR